MGLLGEMVDNVCSFTGLYFKTTIIHKTMFQRASTIRGCICIKIVCSFWQSSEAFVVQEQLMGQFGLNVNVPIFWREEGRKL